MIQAPPMQQAAADRYRAMLTGFVAAVRAAIVSATNPQQAKAWQEKALRALESQLVSVNQAMTHFVIGDQQPLISAAMQSRFLARDLDSYPLTFAGEEVATKLEEQRRLVVLAAWQLCESVGAV